MNNISLQINICIDDDSWETKPNFKELSSLLSDLEKATILCFRESGLDSLKNASQQNKNNSDNKTLEISLTLTNDVAIRELNNQYREKDKPTNVLSFPQYEPDDLRDPAIFEKTPLPVMLLGDVIVSFDTIEKEAKEQQKSFYAHFLHMYVHSVLHLLGFDHIIESEREIMEAMEIRILSNFEINNPYIVATADE